MQSEPDLRQKLRARDSRCVLHASCQQQQRWAPLYGDVESFVAVVPLLERGASGAGLASSTLVANQKSVVVHVHFPRGEKECLKVDQLL